MRNLILFVQRYYVFFLFFLLLVASLGVVVNYNYYQKASFLTSANAVTGNFFSAVSDVRNYFQLKSENEQLREENANLRSVLMSSYYVDTVTEVRVNDSIYSQQYSYIPAMVINNSTNKKYNYLTLDKGYLHGISAHDGVICKDGVVGVVVYVSEHFCTVRSVLNRESNISPKVDSISYFGSLTWDGGNARIAQLKEINMFAPVKAGQKVLTSGYSLDFPESIMIGTIKTVSLKEGNNFYDIDVELSTNFSSLGSVYIVKHLMKKELLELQDSIKKID